MKKMAGFAAAVFLGLMLTSCQGTQKAEQSGYKVFCRNAEATALREVQYEPEAEGGEKLVEELLSAMEGTFNRNDYQSVFPEGLTAAVSTLKDGRLTIDFNDAYRLGYDRVGCWCCPNNNQRAQFLSRIYMPEQAKAWRDFLIDFARKIGKPDAEEYVDSGAWKARQGGNGLAAAGDVKIRFTNCTTEDYAKIYRLVRPMDDEFLNMLTPFGRVAPELGQKLLHEVLVLDIRTNVPILSVQPFEEGGYEFAVKIRTINVKDHDDLQHMVGYQVRKFNACRKCLKCESLCKAGAISISADRYYIDPEKCVHCKMCVTAKYLRGGCMMDKYLRTKD